MQVTTLVYIKVVYVYIRNEIFIAWNYHKNKLCTFEKCFVRPMFAITNIFTVILMLYAQLPLVFKQMSPDLRWCT